MKRFYLFFLLLPNYLFAICNGVPNTEPQSTPSKFSDYMVLSSEQEFNDPGFTSIIPGDDFDINILGRTPTEQQDQKDLAIAFFLSQYGVDFTGGDIDPTNKWGLLHLSTSSQYNQRIIYAADSTVPTDGWVVHQGFYRMVALSQNTGDPSIAYGVWGGVGGRPVMFGTFADYGEMRIEVRVPCSTSGFQESNLDIRYQSVRPTFEDILATSLGSSLGYLGVRGNIDYELIDINSVVVGNARGRLELKDLGGGDYVSQVRMELKFS